MKIEFSSQRREMLLFLTTNMAAMTSRANQQLYRSYLYYISQEVFLRRDIREGGILSKEVQNT